MTLLTPLQGELLIALFTILFGIVIEKWYVSRSSIAINVATWFVILFTLDIRNGLIFFMALWLIMGLLLTKVRGWGGVKQLFGSKVFGSAALILGLYKFGLFGTTGLWWILVIFLALVGIVFVCGRQYADSDDRDQYEEYWW